MPERMPGKIAHDSRQQGAILLASMMRLRRFATLVLLPLAFQQALAAKGVVCVRQTATDSAGAATAMTGMNMSAAPHKDGAAHRPTRRPCDKPFGPGDCQPFGACGATVVLPVTSSIAVGNEILRERFASLIVLPPTSRTTAPEPPPPRI